MPVVFSIALRDTPGQVVDIPLSAVASLHTANTISVAHRIISHPTTTFLKV
jgi:ACT domain-containing protein